MKFFASVRFPLAVVLLVTTVDAVPAKIPMGCFQDDPAAPAFAALASGIDITDTITPTGCTKTCLETGYLYASMAAGPVCSCSSDEAAVLALASSTCDLLCDGEDCGADASDDIVAVYGTGGGSPNFTLAASTDNAAVIDLEVVPDSTGTTFLVDYGYGSPLSYFNDTTAMMAVDVYLVPGHYELTIIGIIEGTPFISIERANLTKTEVATSVDLLECPIVVEPDVEYYCNFSATPVDETSLFKATFDDDGAMFELPGGADFYRLGNPPPRAMTSEVAPPASATNVIMMFDHQVTVEAEVIAFDLYGYEAGAFTVSLKRPTCASGVYCIDTRGCMAECPFELHTNTHTCPAPQWFWSSPRVCSDPSGAVGLQAPDAAPSSWDDVPGTVVAGSFAAEGFHRELLSAPVVVLPGDIIHITGPVGKMVSARSGGDEVDGVATNSHHFASAIIKENVPIQIAHICTTVHTDVNLQAEDANDATVMMTNHTSCERNITDIAMKVSQIETDTFDATLNVEEPYYIRTITPAVFTAIFSVAGPTDFTYTYIPDYGTNHTFFDDTDYPFTGTPYEVEHTVDILPEGVYTVTITAENQHNVIPGPIQNQVTLLAQHEVVTTWTVAPNSNDGPIGAFHVPITVPEIIFEDTASANFPTNATVKINWGDGTPEEEHPFINPGDQKPIISHVYAVGQVYDVTAYIYNMVSGYDVTCQIEIIEQIFDFAIANKFFQTDFSVDSRDGYGSLKNQYPKDRNLTFYPDMSYGTVHTYEIQFTNNQSEVFRFSPIDKFQPLEDYFYYHFDIETLLNLTIVAVNQFERIPVDVFVEVLQQTKVANIDDFTIVTGKDEEKTIEVTFLKLGGSTCMVIDWGDTNFQELDSFGDEYICMLNFSHAAYNPTPALDITNTLSHTYTGEGVFNISVFAYNPVSTATDTLMIIVTNLNCRPPTVEILKGEKDFLAAPQFYKGEDNPIMSLSTINCEETSKTKKRWQIYEVDYLDGYLVMPILTMDIVPSWNMSEVILPARYLHYGRYMITYTLTMWDLEVLDPDLPFQTIEETYFEIIPTPLEPIMFTGGVMRIIRGPDQEILFDPITNSLDPDYPDQKNFTVAWRCRSIDEAWPADDSVPNPIWPPGTSGTGCFGYGPGLLDYDGGNLTVLGSDFIGFEKIYEIEAILYKDTRTASALGQVHVVSYNPPIIDTRCLVDALCKGDVDGVWVNPSLKMSLTSECSDFCLEPHDFKWTLLDQSEAPLTAGTEHFIVGDSLPEFAIAAPFFDIYESQGKIKIQVEATNPEGALGGAMFFMKINKRPANGYCTVIEPATRLALLDTYVLECGNWIDPEGEGIVLYSVFTMTPDGVQTPLTDVPYIPTQPNPADLIFAPGTFDIVVHIYDKWDAFTIVTAISGIEVLMPTEEQLENADIPGLIANLAGAGNAGLLTMVLAAQTAVVADAPWLSLADDDIANLSREELDARLVKIANMNNDALDALMENTNYNTLGKVSAAASTVAGMLEAASLNLESYKTIDMEARDKVADVSENILNGLMDLDVPSSDLLLPIVNYMGTIAGGMALGQGEAGSKDTCQNAPPNDVIKADALPFDTRVTGIDMVIPENPTDILKCNVRDLTKKRAKRIVPLIEGVLDKITQSMISRMVTGESYELTTPNDIHVKMAVVLQLGVIPIGTEGSKFTFPPNFCPQGSCEKPVAYSIREWPFITHAYPDTSDNLAPGTKILDFELYDRNTEIINVRDAQEDILIDIPYTLGKMGDNSLPDYEYVDAITESANQLLPTVYTTFEIAKENAAINLEIIPEENNPRLFLMISKPRLPTVYSHEFYILVKDIPKVNGTHTLFIESTSLNGTGRYFVGIGEFKEDFQTSLMNDPAGNNLTGDILTRLSTNYQLRIFSSGCYFFNKTTTEWASDGMTLKSPGKKIAGCATNHLTSFGTGMFVMPNTIDFNYVFANMGFNDNLTIYLTLIISLSIFVILFIWARLADRKDLQKLGASPLQDNRVQDKYFYEMLIFTGNVKEAQTDSIVQFIVSGEEDETDVRTLADSKRKILRKGDVDVFVMAVPRPLGPLQYLRIWHDNSGKGPNASWNLCYIVFRDVQTGDKYEFICNQWLAVEHDDGQIDRLLQVAGKEQKSQFSHLFTTTKNKNITDGHLWFSVFLRPPRSRFTRCQRVGSCFALLFLSMLVNAMWYDTVAEQPGTGGLNLGPFHLSPEQIGVGVMSNLIVFPPSFLIVFMFRKSQPRKLRQSRIEKAYERTKKEKGGEDENEEDYVDDQEDEEKEVILHKKVIEKKEKNKKLTLPWWTKILAWILVVVCIAASCFFLLMYGIMFGNSKATKWVTSLIISFFSSVLFVQPLKIFLTAILVSAIFKSKDLDEDDSEEDEEDPNLEQDESWLHKGEKTEKNFKQKKVDSEELQRLRQARKKEVEMWSILKEIFFYSFFLWALLIISYGNRDPNAFYLQKSLREGFLHEGAFDGTDYTLVNDADKFWQYLFTGLMTDLRADFLYNGVPPYGLRGFMNDWCNRIMGYATIRQIRVNEHTCRIPEAMYGIEDDCSGFSSITDEDSRDYCADWAHPTNVTKNTPECNIPEFKYETAAQLKALPIWGQRDWYGGGGYVIHLQESTGDIYTKFRELQERHWIDRKTRAILIEFSSYNSQVNLFGMSLIMAEFTPGGGINPSFRFDGIRLLQHHDNFGLFVIGCELLFVGFVIYYTVRELKLACKQKKHYFDTYWSYAEIAIITASYFAIIMYILRHLETSAALQKFKETNGNGYVRMQYAASLNEAYGYLVAFIVFVGTIKFSKLLRFNKRIGVLSATLHKCWDDLSGFLMAFFLCFSSFVMMFFMLLNMYLEGFYNIITAIETCFSMMLGKFQFEEMKQVSMMVPIMFFVFVVCNSWVLINLLLTLIIKAFQQVKHDLMNQPNEYEMVAFVWGRFRTFLGMGPPTHRNEPLTTFIRTKEQQEVEQNKVTELPSKVDKFLDYLNNVYFAGSLDVNNRDALKSSFYRNEMSRKASGIIGLDSAYKGPKSSAGNFGNNGDNWRGALGDNERGSHVHTKKQNEKKSEDQNPGYDGPRISNKFQAELDDF